MRKLKELLSLHAVGKRHSDLLEFLMQKNPLKLRVVEICSCMALSIVARKMCYFAHPKGSD